MNLFYNESYGAVPGDHSTLRKADWIAASLREAVVPVRLISPLPALTADLLKAHSTAYLDAVRLGSPRALANSSSLWAPQMWEAATASAGGVCSAVHSALTTGSHAGSLSSGLHHARYDRGSAFCTFNALAAAALDCQSRQERVLILDLDAHCGGGTNQILNRAPAPLVTHLDVSVNAFDSYGPERENDQLWVVNVADAYIKTIERALDALSHLTFDVVIYNAGMDPHEDDGVAGLPGIDEGVLATRETLVFDWAESRGFPVAFALAGGYANQELLVRLHRLTICRAADAAYDWDEARFA